MLLVEVFQGAVQFLMLAADVLNSGGDKEILLLQAQALALVVVVRGIDDLGNGLGGDLLLHCLEVFAGGVVVHIDRGGTFGIPQTKLVHVVGLIAGDQHIHGHSQHIGAAHLLTDKFPLLVNIRVDAAAKADRLALFPPGHEPGIAQFQPLIRQLDLPAVGDLLFEQAQLITDGIADGGNFLGSHALQIAGGQSAQAAVTQAGIRLQLKEVAGRKPHGLNSLLKRLHNPQIIGIFHQRAAHQKLHAQIVHALRLCFIGSLAARAHAFMHQIFDDQRHGAVILLVGRFLRADAEEV